MKRSFLSLNRALMSCTTIIVAAATLFCAPGGDVKADKVKTEPLIGTIATVEEFNKVVSTAGDRLLMFDLYADWCMPCRILSPLLEKIAVERRDKVSIYKINIDKSRDIAGALGVTGIPFVVFIKNREGVYALTGVQSRDTYLRVIDQFAASSPAKDIEPDGTIVAGVRVIRLNPAATPGDIYVYRGETVTLVLDTILFPYSVHIPGFNVSQEGAVGKRLDITFKAGEAGVYPIFCNGDCPTGDGAQYGRIIVMEYKGASGVKFNELTVDEAVALMETKPLMLDVRTPNEYHSGHIEGAKLVPLQQLDERIGELSGFRERDILIYCRSGNRSIVAAEILIRNGFKKTHHLKSGVIGWEKAGKKLVK